MYIYTHKNQLKQHHFAQFASVLDKNKSTRKGIPECLLNKSTVNFEIRNAFNFLHACL
jgi:hypothetical protein